MLSAYDPNFDYRPWIAQTSDDAIAWYVQRINEQVATAELFGGTT
jgi:hypothetical protein